MRPDRLRTCKRCGSHALRRLLIEDQPGVHEYLMLCQTCGHEHSPWLEFHGPAVTPEPLTSLAWLGRVAVVGCIPTFAMSILLAIGLTYGL
jgi:hypothetical protein